MKTGKRIVLVVDFILNCCLTIAGGIGLYLSMFSSHSDDMNATALLLLLFIGLFFCSCGIIYFIKRKNEKYGFCMSEQMCYAGICVKIVAIVVLIVIKCTGISLTNLFSYL